MPTVSIEAGASLGWTEWFGGEGAVIGVDRFGQSGSAPDNFRDYGLTADAIVASATDLLGLDS